VLDQKRAFEDFMTKKRHGKCSAKKTADDRKCMEFPLGNSSGFRFCGDELIVAIDYKSEQIDKEKVKKNDLLHQALFLIV
jgi:hypothetical protein